MKAWIIILLMSTERDIHFAIFAESHYLELSDLFAQMYACQILNDHSGEDETRHAIEDLLAQRAYDLALHIVRETGYGMDRFYITERVAEIPDLTEWPPKPDQP
jgi:hypothetical protein